MKAQVIFKNTEQCYAYLKRDGFCLVDPIDRNVTFEDFPDFSFFLHRRHNTYSVTEYMSGLCTGSGNTIQEAIQNAKERMEGHQVNFHIVIKRSLRETGLSPGVKMKVIMLERSEKHRSRGKSVKEKVG